MFEIFSYDFMLRALVAGLILSVVAPTIGIFFVVRRSSAISDTLAHVSFAGVAAALLFNFSGMLGALIACVLATLGMERIRDQRTLPMDTVVTLFLFGGLALGVVLLGLASGGASVSSYLFGSILTVSSSSLWQMAVIGFVVLVVAAIFFKQLFAISLDEETAEASGLPVKRLNRILALLGAATIAISINVVGVLLIGALMVVPVISAMQFKKGFADTLFIAIVISVLSVISGLLVSFYANLASGATIVLCTIVIFFISIIGVRIFQR